jgi:phosphopantothenoylcysteine decarboxylase / phosphopantothenate---cysteine ligase
VVVNDVSLAEIGFDATENEVVILACDGGRRTIPRAGKEEVARGVLDEVDRLRGLRRGGEGDGAGRARSGAGAGA